MTSYVGRNERQRDIAVAALPCPAAATSPRWNPKDSRGAAGTLLRKVSGALMVKLYNKLCYRYSRYEVWQDMVVMIACAIANAVDKRHFEKREEMYMRVVKKYDKDALNVFPEFFTHIVMGMEEYPDCDFLGELYMNLDLGNRNAGQFFTPYDVCRLMAQNAPEPAQSAVSGSAGLASEGCVRAGRACHAWQGRDCYGNYQRRFTEIPD